MPVMDFPTYVAGTHQLTQSLIEYFKRTIPALLQHRRPDVRDASWALYGIGP